MIDRIAQFPRQNHASQLIKVIFRPKVRSV